MIPHPNLVIGFKSCQYWRGASSIRLVATGIFTPLRMLAGCSIKYSSADLISSLDAVDKFILGISSPASILVTLAVASLSSAIMHQTFSKPAASATA